MLLQQIIDIAKIAVPIVFSVLSARERWPEWKNNRKKKKIEKYQLQIKEIEIHRDNHTRFLSSLERVKFAILFLLLGVAMELILFRIEPVNTIKDVIFISLAILSMLGGVFYLITQSAKTCRHQTNPEKYIAIYELMIAECKLKHDLADLKNANKLLSDMDFTVKITSYKSLNNSPKH